MRRYSVSGRTAATGGAASDCASVLWNGSSNRDLYVVEVHFCTISAASNLNPGLYRTTTRGTTASTTTPDIDNNLDADLTPPSGAVLDLSTFSAQPTLATPPLLKFNLGNQIGSGMQFVIPKPIKVKPGTGLAVASTSANVLAAADITYVWEE